ncbi:MAG: IclR family transcriptional regulator [Sporolactobacillus sp.]
MPEQKPYGTVIIRAKQILDFLEQQDHPVNLQEIYTSLKTSKSTVLKILNTLCSIDYVKRDEETKRYILGTKLISYGEAAKKSFSIAKLTDPELSELNEKIGETVHLGIYERDHVVYIKKLNGKGKIILQSRVGHTLDLYCSGMGKAFLAEQSMEVILDYLNRTPLIKKAKNTITDPEALLDDLKKIKQRGYSIDDEENEDEIFCIGTVLKQGNRILGLFSVSTPVFRMNEQKRNEIISLVREARKSIESKIN